MPGRCWRAQPYTKAHSLVIIQSAQILLKSVISACPTFFSVSYCQNLQNLRVLPMFTKLTPLSKGNYTVLTVSCDLWSYNVQLSDENLSKLHVRGPHEHWDLLQYSSEKPRITESYNKKWDLGHSYGDSMSLIKNFFFLHEILTSETSRKGVIIIKNFFCSRLLYFINSSTKRYSFLLKLD